MTYTKADWTVRGRPLWLNEARAIWHNGKQWNVGFKKNIETEIPPQLQSKDILACPDSLNGTGWKYQQDGQWKDGTSDIMVFSHTGYNISSVH